METLKFLGTLAGAILLIFGLFILLNRPKEPKLEPNAIAHCEGVPAIKIQFLGSEVSGSYKVRIIGDDGKSQIFHISANQCLIEEDEK